MAQVHLVIDDHEIVADENKTVLEAALDNESIFHIYVIMKIFTRTVAAVYVL